MASASLAPMTTGRPDLISESDFPDLTTWATGYWFEWGAA